MDDSAIARARLEIAVASDFLHHVGQIETRRRAAIHATIDPRERQQLTDQRIQPVRFQADPLQVLRGFRGWALLHQAQRDDQSRKWRTQLMRNVAQQAPLPGHQRFNPLRHAIEVASQIGDLIAARSQRWIDARFEPSFGDARGGLAQLL